ncbi:M20/M25/M40 family metallo-hydrolase [Demequina capsici]|uniref:M20/M25/M40 family metallo-hydrolase n=1 Tax=Demequina capsici TaxID=3075620 RepID=A0AA96FAQ9_9MICO|nr:M20/M25/M40 family metallo-hydrolase [Demequina sp. PMTSA13]WNM26512.1 M20/M25/M40 family metallo-hydrolase [Demequina sp. PMTSA13]
MSADDVRSQVQALMPGVIADLEELIAIPSISFPGYDQEPVLAMAERTLEKFRDAGFADARFMDVPSGYPPIYGEIAGPEGAPVVVLYAHYDVQPAIESQGWTSDPWTPTRKADGRIYGRGASDDKSGLVTHLGMMRAFDGRPPVTLRLILEGMEETESNLEAFVEAHPELFRCDLFVICDMGNIRVGDPVMTTALRGDVSCIVKVSTLEHPLHSGVFGGAAPDATMALARLLTTLQDDAGDVAVEGVTAGPWEGADLSEDDFRAMADMLPGVGLVGTGTVADRLWAKPSINAIGLDTTSIADSSNVIHPTASAKISMRIVPGSDPKKELAALVAHLESHAPWGARVEVTPMKAAPPYRVRTDGPGYAAAREAMAEAFGRPCDEAGSGGSIPLLQTLEDAAPGAEFVLWGPEDTAQARIHASDESVDPEEIERMIVAQVLLLTRLAQG